MFNTKEAIIKELIEKTVGDVEEFGDFGLDDNLADFGISSLNFIKILVAIEDEFNIEFEDEELEFENFNTIRKLVNSLNKMQNYTENK